MNPTVELDWTNFELIVEVSLLATTEGGACERVLGSVVLHTVRVRLQGGRSCCTRLFAVMFAVVAHPPTEKSEVLLLPDWLLAHLLFFTFLD